MIPCTQIPEISVVGASTYLKKKFITSGSHNSKNKD
jgi:hypothetical protein